MSRPCARRPRGVRRPRPRSAKACRSTSFRVRTASSKKRCRSVVRKPPARSDAMILAQVVGTVVSTRKDAGLSGLKLLLAREVDGKFQPAGNAGVAVDAVGAGAGALVLIAAGSSARLTEVTKDRPVDHVICGIVGDVEHDRRDAWPPLQ